MNALLRTRRGIPISLGVLWMALAQGMDLNVQGIGFPGHFMVKVHLPRGTVVLDPLTGRSLTTEELSERLAPHHASGTLMDNFEAPLGLYLQPAAPRAIIARMLRNLKEIHRTQEDWPRMLAVQNRLVILLPEDWIEYRDRGLVHAELGNLRQAVHDLDTYLARVPEEPDRRSDYSFACQACAAIAAVKCLCRRWFERRRTDLVRSHSSFFEGNGLYPT